MSESERKGGEGEALVLCVEGYMMSSFDVHINREKDTQTQTPTRVHVSRCAAFI